MPGREVFAGAPVAAAVNARSDTAATPTRARASVFISTS
jgi:hypothetical protein